MWKWFHREGRGRQISVVPEELKGAPKHARVKTYSAETGFVYQYVYRGYRLLATPSLGSEHVFEADRDRKQRFRITVFLLESELTQFSRVIARELIGAERYALVKLSLFEALDTFTDVTQFEDPLIPSAAKMEEHLRTLRRI